MRVETGRNPFGRFTVRKRKVHTSTGCTWCGSTRQTANGKYYLWQYYVDADSPRESGNIKGLFCALDCCNSYHWVAR